MRPSAASAWISFQNSRRAFGSTPGGRFVEQQQLRARQRAGAERQPLLPAARQFAGDLLLAAGEAEPLDRRARGGDRLVDAVDAGDEFQVLAHRKVLIQAEALGHVADLALDLVGFGEDVVAEAGAGPLVGRQQPAQHADGGGLAGAVRSQEAVNRAALDLHGKVAHHRPAVELLGQVVDVDRDVGCAVLRAHFGASFGKVTVTGWPTRNFSGWSGRASIRNTSLARSSRL